MLPSTIWPATPPLPTPCSLPFQAPGSGSQTSNRIAGGIMPEARQKLWLTVHAPIIGSVLEKGPVSFAVAIGVPARVFSARLSQVAAPAGSASRYAAAA